MSQITTEDLICEVAITITKIFAIVVGLISSHDRLSTCIMQKIQTTQFKNTKFFSVVITCTRNHIVPTKCCLANTENTKFTHQEPLIIRNYKQSSQLEKKEKHLNAAS